MLHLSHRIILRRDHSMPFCYFCVSCSFDYECPGTSGVYWAPLKYTGIGGWYYSRITSF